MPAAVFSGVHSRASSCGSNAAQLRMGPAAAVGNIPMNSSTRPKPREARAGSRRTSIR